VSAVRPLERADLVEVADLYELVARSGSPKAPPGLAGYFERTLLDQPWADPEIPSLVMTGEDGAIIAFQGSSVRRARFDGGSIRIACAGQLVAHPDARRFGAGARLVSAYLKGDQDLTITDGATEQMREIWTLLGGDVAELRCVEWVRVFRPVQLLAEFVAWRRGAPRTRRRGIILATLDRALARVSPVLPAPVAHGLLSTPLTPATLIEYLPDVAGQRRIHLAYDEPYLAWLFGELKAVVTRGEPVGRLVRDARGGRVLGWYIYYLQPGGVSHVLQIAARGRDIGPVMDDLLHHAWSGGTAAIRGRVESGLLDPIARRRGLLRYAGDALVHSRSEEILGALAGGDGLLTRLDGEWWMGHHVLDFGRDR
jgi:hypothetical protein